MGQLTEARAYRDGRMSQRGSDMRQTGEARGRDTSSNSYREEYGTTLTDEQFTAANEEGQQFADTMAQGRGEIALSQKELDKSKATLKGAYDSTDKSYKESMGLISKAGEDAMKPFEGGFDKWAEDNTGMINVYSDGKYEGTYRVANSVTTGLAQQAIDIHDEEGDWLLDFGEDNSERDGFKLDVHGYGGSWHEQLYEAQDMTKMSWDAAYGEAQAATNKSLGEVGSTLNAGYSSALGDLDEYQGQIDTAQGGLDTQSSTISGYENTRTESLNGIRMAYSKRLERIRATIMGRE